MSRRWLAQRLASVAAVMLLATLLTYLILEALPGSTAVTLLPPDATPEQVAIVERDLNLDRPLPMRYGIWLSRAVRGDLGVSYRTGEVVAVALRQRIPTSLELLVLTQLVAVGAAVPAALASARKERSRTDRSLSAASFVALALPQFAFGIVLLIVFAQKLRWFPVADYQPLREGLFGNLRSLALPVVTLAVPLAGIYFRVLRTDVVQTLRSEHIGFAHAMGLSPRRILWRRALRPSSLTMLSVIGLNTAYLLGGAVIVETIFSVPGLGLYLSRSVAGRDVVAVQGAVLAIAVVFVLINLAVDVALSLLDPRVRFVRSDS